MDMTRRAAAEFFGTLWLVLGGCGAAVLAAAFPALGIGFLGVAFAFGLTVLTMAYAVGHISGGHFNPAVTVGLWAGGRFKTGDVLPYIIAQVIGAIVAAAILYAIASGKPGWVPGGFASNGYGELSPGKYSLGACFLTEVVATFFFLFVIIGSTSQRGGGRLCRHPDRAVPDPDPSDHDPGHQHLGQPRSQHRAGAVRRRALYRAAVAVLAGADHRRRNRRIFHPLALSRRTGHRRNRGRRGRADRLSPPASPRLTRRRGTPATGSAPRAGGRSRRRPASHRAAGQRPETRSSTAACRCGYR